MKQIKGSTVCVLVFCLASDTSFGFINPWLKSDCPSGCLQRQFSPILHPTGGFPKKSQAMLARRSRYRGARWLNRCAEPPLCIPGVSGGETETRSGDTVETSSAIESATETALCDAGPKATPCEAKLVNRITFHMAANRVTLTHRLTTCFCGG